MIFPYKITVEELSKVGKNYNWPNHTCEDCKRTMWGHGYVVRYFEEISKQIFLKRYRCPTCHSVVTFRPEAYWPRVRSSIRVAYETLVFRLNYRSNKMYAEPVKSLVS